MFLFRWKKVLLGLTPFIFFGWMSAVTPLYAATCSLSISPGSFTTVPSTMIVDQRVKIYLSLEAVCPDDIEGTVTFFQQGSSFGSKPFSIRSGGKPEEVWMSWRPTSEGSYELRVEASGSSDNPPSTVVQTTSMNIFVDRDSDGDGIPDRLDADMDNDGLTNEEEKKIGTDSLKVDTDQDGVDDKRDAFPLDPNRSKLPPPPLPPVITVLPVAQAQTKPVAVAKKILAPLKGETRSAMPLKSMTPSANNPSSVASTAGEPSPTVVVASPVIAVATTSLSASSDTLVIPPAAVVAVRKEEVSVNTEGKKDSTRSPFSSPAVAGMTAAATVSAGAAGFFLWKARAAV